MSTIQDVAKEASVSVATISRVLNDSSSVKPDTRDIVLQAIKKLNYRPNLIGRNLRKMNTRMVLVLLPTIANPFYSRVVKGIEDVAHKNGYNVMLCNTDSDAGREKVYLELLRNRLSDGVIFMAPELTMEELNDIACNFPVVQCCEYKEGAHVPHVSVDNFKAAHKATKHLLNLGHKRIGFISARNKFLSTSGREAGYKKALEEAGIRYDPDIVKYGDYGFKSGIRTCKELLSLKNRPTAIFAISDIMAIGAMRSIRDNGLQIPDDIAVVGFDNISFASMTEPMLTTISQPKYDLGCTAMELFLEQINGTNKEPGDVFLEFELIIRESTVR